jgi:hypothetical protein
MGSENTRIVDTPVEVIHYKGLRLRAGPIMNRIIPTHPAPRSFTTLGQLWSKAGMTASRRDIGYIAQYSRNHWCKHTKRRGSFGSRERHWGTQLFDGC